MSEQQIDASVNVGDVVRLKSGSPAMTVDAIENDRATCVWFVDQQCKSEKFALASLEANNTPRSIQVEFVMPSRREDNETSTVPFEQWVDGG